MRRLAALTVVALASSVLVAPVHAAPSRPVLFVHGMGASAAEQGRTAFADLLTAIAERHPMPGVCQRDAQGERPWDGSPCVFRYVDDMAGAAEGSEGPNDSQSGVRENADKLAEEISEVVASAGERVILIGYSMGGAIIRTYLALHHEAAEQNVQAVILVDAAASGAWGLAALGELPRRVPGPLGERLMTTLRTFAAEAQIVNLDRPAVHDTRPRSDLYREITALPVPDTISYYTFWGDIRVVVGRKLLVYDLPSYELPSLGDLGLLPGDPDPAALPELGGQRFSPDGVEVWDVPHGARIDLSPEVVRDLIDACGRQPSAGSPDCLGLIGGMFAVPNEHSAVQFQTALVMVEHPDDGAPVSLLDAVLEAVERNQ